MLIIQTLEVKHVGKKPDAWREKHITRHTKLVGHVDHSRHQSVDNETRIQNPGHGVLDVGFVGLDEWVDEDDGVGLRQSDVLWDVDELDAVAGGSGGEGVGVRSEVRVERELDD